MRASILLSTLLLAVFGASPANADERGQAQEQEVIAYYKEASDLRSFWIRSIEIVYQDDQVPDTFKACMADAMIDLSSPASIQIVEQFIRDPNTDTARALLADTPVFMDKAKHSAVSAAGQRCTEQYLASLYPLFAQANSREAFFIELARFNNSDRDAVSDAVWACAANKMRVIGEKNGIFSEGYLSAVDVFVADRSQANFIKLMSLDAKDELSVNAELRRLLGEKARECVLANQ